mgnify:CR=1 FL=1|jgi:hypothetical protein
MKSKAYILMQIKTLLDTNRGLCEDEIDQWIDENKEKTVYELLTIKKHLSETMEYPDVSCMARYRD